MALITGTAIDPSGDPVVGGVISFSLNPDVIAAEGGNTVFPASVNTTTGAAGEISFTLSEGEYIGVYTSESGYVAEFGFSVPAGAAADFNDCIVALVHH